MKKKQVCVEMCQEDLDQGLRSDAARCPIARALTRKVGVPVQVGPNVVFFQDPNGRHWYAQHSGSSTRFVLDFDQGGPQSVRVLPKFQLRFVEIPGPPGHSGMWALTWLACNKIWTEAYVDEATPPAPSPAAPDLVSGE